MGRTKAIAVTNSATGYQPDNFVRHLRHFPFCITKENTGINSYQSNSFLQLSQYDLPIRTFSLRGSLSESTNKNPPIINPSKKRNGIINNSIQILCNNYKKLMSRHEEIKDLCSSSSHLRHPEICILLSQHRQQCNEW